MVKVWSISMSYFMRRNKEVLGDLLLLLIKRNTWSTCQFANSILYVSIILPSTILVGGQMNYLLFLWNEFFETDLILTMYLSSLKNIYLKLFLWRHRLESLEFYWGSFYFWPAEKPNLKISKYRSWFWSYFSITCHISFEGFYLPCKN